MARSDNMLAHGFMSSMGIPPQDSSLFVSNLLAEPGRSSRLELKHEVWSSRIKHKNIELYSVPMEEFDILHLTLETGKDSEIIEGEIDGPSIWIVVKGTVEVEVVDDKGTPTEQLATGQIVFVKPGTGLKFSKVGNEEVEAWAAFCEG
jgi:mannose-6-phosphate isomerase-like protein (cupin superfamily)